MNCEKKANKQTNYTVMTHTPWLEILLLGSVGQSDKCGISHGKDVGHVVQNYDCNVCGSTHCCGCVVNCSFARATI